jgi:hypothetical protein
VNKTSATSIATAFDRTIIPPEGIVDIVILALLEYSSLFL